jgi:hypothetical protein
LATQSKDYANDMKANKQIVVILAACNAAAKQFVDENDPSAGIKKTDMPIAFKFSKQYPNVTVLAADGYVVYSSKSILGVENY